MSLTLELLKSALESKPGAIVVATVPDSTIERLHCPVCGQAMRLDLEGTALLRPRCRNRACTANHLDHRVGFVVQARR